jgi:hypothetical protein
MDTLLTIIAGLGFRLLVDSISDNLKLAASLVGLWEGFVVYHYLSNKRFSLDPPIAYAFRLFVEFIFTRDSTRTLLVLLWTALGMGLSEVAATALVERRRPRNKSPHLLRTHPSRRVVDSRVRFHPIRSSTPKPSPLAARVGTSAVQTTSPEVTTEIVSRDLPSTALLFQLSPEDEFIEPSQGGHRDITEIRMEDIHDLEAHRPALDVEVDTLAHSLKDVSTPKSLVVVDLHDCTAEELPAPLIPGPVIVPLEDNIQLSSDDNDSNACTPMQRAVMLPTPESPISLLPAIDDHDGLPLLHLEPLVSADHDTADPSLASILVQDTVTADERRPIASSPPKRINVTTLPDSSLSSLERLIDDIPIPDDISIGASEQTLADQESVITAGSRDFVISRADNLREQAFSEERERDRLSNAMTMSFREGRIRDGHLLQGDAQEADERSRRLHERAARRYFHGTLIPFIVCSLPFAVSHTAS